MGIRASRLPGGSIVGQDHANATVLHDIVALLNARVGAAQANNDFAVYLGCIKGTILAEGGLQVKQPLVQGKFTEGTELKGKLAQLFDRLGQGIKIVTRAHH